MSYPFSYIQTAFAKGGATTSTAAIGLNLATATQFSLEAWVRVQDGCTYKSIIRQQDAFEFAIDGAALCFSRGTARFTAPLCPIPTGRWVFVSMCYFEGEVSLYVDAEDAGTGTLGGGAPCDAGSTFEFGVNLSGALREVRVYAEALSALIMKRNMYLAPTGALTAQYAFNQSPPAEKKQGKAISLGSGARVLNCAPAARFTGSGYLKVKEDSAINPGGFADKPFSIQFWACFEAVANQKRYVLLSSTDRNHGFGLILSVYATDGKKGRLVIEYGDFTAPHRYETGDVLTENTWFNAALTYEAGNLILYLNGASVLTQSQFIPLAEPFLVHRMGIGADLSAGVEEGSDLFVGYLHDLSIWSKALAASDVTSCMTSLPTHAEEGLSVVLQMTNDAMQSVADYAVVYTVGDVSAGEHTLPAPAAAQEAAAPPCACTEPFTHAEREAFRAAAFSGLAHDATQIAVTHHARGSRVYFVVHLPHTSYTAMDVAADGLDDETMWWIQLILMILSGAVDIILGITLRYSDAMARFIQANLMTTASLRSILDALAGAERIMQTISATLYALWKSGKLWELFRMQSYSFWTILSFIADLALYAVPGYAFAKIARFTYLVTSILVHIKNKPQGLNAVALKSLNFNHDTPDVMDAITIRRDEYNALPMPEWQAGQNNADSYAVYSIARITKKPAERAAITVKVACVRSQTGRYSCRLRAVDSTGFLGTSEALSLSFEDSAASGLIRFPSHAIDGGGVQKKSLTLQWQVSADGKTWQHLIDTQHVLYALLDYPGKPWGVRNTQTMAHPWLTALDATIGYVSGATTPDAVAQRITQAVNEKMALSYTGSSMFLGLSADAAGNYIKVYNLGNFLTAIGKGRTLNCVDCENAVTALSNLYGCRLCGIKLANPSIPEDGFACNKVVSIGAKADDWKVPFNWGYSFHAVSCLIEGPSIKQKRVYDACLKVNGSSTPWNDTGRTALLPVKLALSQNETPTIVQTVPTDAYRERLAKNDATGVLSCAYVGFIDKRDGCLPVRTNAPYPATRPAAIALEWVEFAPPLPYLRVERRGVAGHPYAYEDRYAHPTESNGFSLLVIPMQDAQSAQAALKSDMKNAAGLLAPTNLAGTQIAFTAGDDMNETYFTKDATYIRLVTWGVSNSQHLAETLLATLRRTPQRP